MATYVVLANFTDQGIRNVKDSPERLSSFRAAAEKLGFSIRHAYYTVGTHDMVVIVEGPDDAITAGLLRLGSLGNVRTTSMRAHTVDEMKSIIGRIG